MWNWFDIEKVIRIIETFSDRYSPAKVVYDRDFTLYEHAIAWFADTPGELAYLASRLSADAYAWLLSVQALSPYF